MYRYVPGARRELQRLVFSSNEIKIDLESSKMIGEREHLLVLQSVARKQVGSKTRKTATTAFLWSINNQIWLLTLFGICRVGSTSAK